MSRIRRADVAESLRDQIVTGLHVGRLTEQKNLDTLIRSLAILGPEYTGIFVGKGPKAHYESLATEWGALDRCYFIESVPNAELAEFYSFADCFCTPSRWYARSRPANSASRSG